MSLDPQDLYDVVAINAASASTQLAGLPFSGPIGGVRVACSIDGTWVAFPTVRAARAGRVRHGRRRPVVGSGDNDVAIMMVEAEATENVVELIAGGAQAPTEAVVAEGPRGRQAVHQARCARRSRSWPIARPSRPASTPSSPITATTCTTRSPRWPPTSCPRR